MLQDCLEVFEAFERKKKEEGRNPVFDRYVPKDGTYILVDVESGELLAKDIEIHYNKRTRELEGRNHLSFQEIQYYDYYSSLIDMNKPIDSKKVIHSNNFLSFFLKKDSIGNGKLTEEIVAGYYKILSEPDRKYQAKKKTRELYKAAEKELGPVDVRLLEKCRRWIAEHIFKLSDLGIETEGKDYLKIFFVLGRGKEEETKQLYQTEGLRYLYPNIFNSNEYNVMYQGQIWGMPNNNMGLNAKKVYLEHKTRMETIPYMVSREDVLRQKKLFDYLAALAAMGEVNVYFDCIRNEVDSYPNDKLPDRETCGTYLRLQKEKEVKIQEVDYVSQYQTKLTPPFRYHDYINRSEKFQKAEYGRYHKLWQMAGVVDAVLFSGWLQKNLFTEAKDLKTTDSTLKENILFARKSMFRWMYLGESNGLPEILDKVSERAVLSAVRENSLDLVSQRLNLRLSLQSYFKRNKEGAMEISEIRQLVEQKINGNGEEQFESEEEFFYGVGQLLYYLFTRSKAANKKMSMINPFITAKSVKTIKERLQRLFLKYNHDIQLIGPKRVKYLFAMICSYNQECRVNQDMMWAGFCSNNLIYKKDGEVKANE